MGMTTKLYTKVPKAIDNYRIERNEFGIAVFGPIPVTEFCGLVQVWEQQGYKLLDAVIAEHLHASAAIVKDHTAGQVWREALGLRADNPDWLMSGDTGISSKTIYAVFTGVWHCLRRGMDDADVPHDADDFGRCYRLLQRYPEWRARLSEVAGKFPIWGPLVREWDRLTALHEQSSSTLDNEIHKLETEGRELANRES